MALGNSLFFDGEFFDARWHFEQGIALYEQQPHSSETILSVRDPGVICYSLHALALWKLGYPKRAAHMSHTALARAHEISHPFSLAFADYLASVLAQFQRNPEKAYEFASAASTLATEQELGPWMLGQTTIVQGWALVMQGQGVAGIAHIKQGLKTLQALGAHMPWPLFQLIDAYRTMGQTEEGLQVLDTIPDMQGDANPEGQPPNVTERQVAVEIPGLYWLKGELLLQLPRPDFPQAEACFQQALTLARYQGAKADELRVTVSLCRLWQQLNKHQVARQTLAEIYAWFDKEDDTRDLVEARALLETLASA
jgi:predicted ATPase